jgi:hypothetical protein
MFDIHDVSGVSSTPVVMRLVVILLIFFELLVLSQSNPGPFEYYHPGGPVVSVIASYSILTVVTDNMKGKVS